MNTKETHVNATNLIWLDLEMTGLDPSQDRILEIAVMVTDAQLNLLTEGLTLTIYQPTQILSQMDSWVTTQHTQSGLIERVKKSQLNETQAEEQVLTFLHAYVPQGASPLCGNSICMDRRFLVHYMPRLEHYFHYRHIDVSTIKELAARWVPEIKERFQKENQHLALADVKESIRELRYYREHFFFISVKK